MRTPAGFTGDGDPSAAASLLSSPPPSSSSFSSTTGGPHSAWHSPVPYLFGGLAAMLGLIAFALLILACSFWQLSSYLDHGETDPDAADSGGDPSADHQKPSTADPAVLDERFLVIMPGDDAPTVLAIPISKRPSATSFAPSTAAPIDQDIRQPSS